MSTFLPSSSAVTSVDQHSASAFSDGAHSATATGASTAEGYYRGSAGR